MRADVRGRPRSTGGIRGDPADITARKLAQEKLEATQERLELAVEAVQMGVWDWDLARGRWQLAAHHP